MEKRIFRIKTNRKVADRTFRLDLEACEPGYVFSGEFVDIAVPGFYLRRPLSVCGYESGTISIIYKTVGHGTEALAGMEEGRTLEVICGLGHGFTAGACRESALLVAGGLGAAPLLPVCRELAAAGKRTNVILGFNTASEIVLEDEFRSVADSVTIVTMDGSSGQKGFVTDHLPDGGFDFFYTCGPLVMMKAVCAKIDVPGEASLEERMGCGAGFCYGCSCKTLTGTKRICQDGPVFRKEDIIW